MIMSYFRITKLALKSVTTVFAVKVALSNSSYNRHLLAVYSIVILHFNDTMRSTLLMRSNRKKLLIFL